MRRGIVSILSALVLVISIGLVIAAQTVTPAQRRQADQIMVGLL